ncbi:MAG: 50S ribosomal protein L9 [Candidatus Omnitrophica bacterium]|nr:50S ribosomal protein L9 [Candidatus Omnitrophota bacterium]
MEVILLQDVESLGKAGKTVTVKDGYARNFLIPRGLGVPATAKQQSQLNSLRALQLRQAETLKAKATELQRRLEEILLTVAVSVGDQGKLHGAVTAMDICEGLRGQGVALEKHQVILKEPITQLGVIPVPVKLHPEITATLRVSVVQK